MNSRLSCQSQQARTSPRGDATDCGKAEGWGASCGEGGVPAGLARSSRRPPRWSCSREQQAAHLVQELQRGRRWGGGRSPQASHKSRLWSQGAGGGQGPGGSCSGTHTGPGREARVRCGCKSSPKCFQAEANQGAVTAHTRPGPTGPWGGTPMSAQAYTRSQIQKHARTRPTYRAALARHHTWIPKDTGAGPASCGRVCLFSTPHKRKQCCTRLHSHPRTWRWPKTLRTGIYTHR